MRGFQRSYSVGATPVRIAQANPNRRGLLMDLSSGAAVAISAGQAPTDGSGFYLGVVNEPIYLTQEDYGQLVQLDFWAIQSPASDPNSSASVTVLGSALSGATTGIKLTTGAIPAPGGKLLSATFILLGGTPPTESLQLVRGATTYTLANLNANINYSSPVALQTGDVVQWNIVAAGATSTFDATITYQGNNGAVAGGNSLVTAWEIEG